MTYDGCYCTRCYTVYSTVLCCTVWPPIPACGARSRVKIQYPSPGFSRFMQAYHGIPRCLTRAKRTNHAQPTYWSPPTKQQSQQAVQQSATLFEPPMMMVNNLGKAPFHSCGPPGGSKTHQRGYHRGRPFLYGNQPHAAQEMLF